MTLTVALRFAYDGSCVDSYARQPDQDTVESRLMDALRAEGLVEGGWRTGSRTDRGVSAAENVAKAVLERPHLRGLVPALNTQLAAGVWVTGAAEVTSSWDPRRAAWRRYAYTAPGRGEDLERMAAACDAFVGRHDMRAFARLDGGRDPVREVSAFEVQEAEMGWLLRVTAPNFLWNQVRRMVDAVLRVGRGEADASDIAASLRSGQRHGAFQVAPAEGLVLERVHYDVAWDPAAGRLDPRRVARAWMQAHSRAAALDRVLSGARR